MLLSSSPSRPLALSLSLSYTVLVPPCSPSSVVTGSSTILCDPEMKSMREGSAFVGNSRSFYSTTMNEAIQFPPSLSFLLSFSLFFLSLAFSSLSLSLSVGETRFSVRVGISSDNAGPRVPQGNPPYGFYPHPCSFSLFGVAQRQVALGLRKWKYGP